MNSKSKFTKISLVGNLNEELGVVPLEHLWADMFALKMKIVKPEAFDQLSDAICQVLKAAEAFGARQIMFRLIKDEILSAQISRLLPQLGFKFKNERIEFTRPVIELPGDAGSPFSWKTAAELFWQPQNIADTLKRVALGDPDTDPNEAPISFIQDFLDDPVLTSGLPCIHIGFVNNEPAAMSVVQINPKTGWSRISYMGVVPEFRRQGLGVWVHRHAFAIMKAQGGKFYHGGTGATNAAMIRLFEAHQCRRLSRMEEWIYPMKEGARC